MENRYMNRYKTTLTALFLTVVFILTIPVNIKAGNIAENIFEARVDKAEKKEQIEEKYDRIYDIINKISGMKFLTDDEKESISKDKKQLLTRYQKIDEIKAKITKVSDKIMKGSDTLNNKYNTIYALNIDLWTKVDADYRDNRENYLSNEERVKKSTSLSSDEKKKLIEDAVLLDKLEERIQVFYDKADKATEKLRGQIQKEYNSIDRIVEKNDSVWEKIFNFSKKT